eukprot:TRINITY_DN15418_c0_g1_i1.p2 TRINITY_DN15418_c0_g1~~TRINITY_DN15418_c0_g1_i1.p2  ORF type:complete len:113 (-),score=2.35 TRINITY_DN15418_c0_g1_i1:142-480(-)
MYLHIRRIYIARIRDQAQSEIERSIVKGPSASFKAPDKKAVMVGNKEPNQIQESNNFRVSKRGISGKVFSAKSSNFFNFNQPRSPIEFYRKNKGMIHLLIPLQLQMVIQIKG